MSNLVNELGFSQTRINADFNVRSIQKVSNYVREHKNNTVTHYGASGATGVTGAFNAFYGDSLNASGIEGITGACLFGSSCGNGLPVASGHIVLGDRAIPKLDSAGKPVLSIGGTGPLAPVVTGGTGPTGAAYTHIKVAYMGNVYRLLAMNDF